MAKNNNLHNAKRAKNDEFNNQKEIFNKTKKKIVKSK